MIARDNLIPAHTLHPFKTSENMSDSHMEKAELDHFSRLPKSFWKPWNYPLSSVDCQALK